MTEKGNFRLFTISSIFVSVVIVIVIENSLGRFPHQPGHRPVAGRAAAAITNTITTTTTDPAGFATGCNIDTQKCASTTRRSGKIPCRGVEKSAACIMVTHA
jgi:hypothetical protein